MKRKIRAGIFLAGLIFTALFFGCATAEKQRAQNVEDLLLAAGFMKKFPQSPEEEAKLNSLKPLKILSVMSGREVRYVYADPYSCKCILVGGQQQFNGYQSLVLQKDVAMDNAMIYAEQMQIAAETDSGSPDWWW